MRARRLLRRAAIGAAFVAYWLGTAALLTMGRLEISAKGGWPW